MQNITTPAKEIVSNAPTLLRCGNQKWLSSALTLNLHIPLSQLNDNSEHLLDLKWIYRIECTLTPINERLRSR